MTDEQIVKAMICCTNFPVCDRDNCPYGESTNCATMLGKDVVELINRQKADIKRLTSGKCVYLSDDEEIEYCVEGPCPHYKTEAQIRAEAIQEFWSRLQAIAYRSEVVWSHGEHPMLIELDDAEEIYEDMVGEKNV